MVEHQSNCLQACVLGERGWRLAARRTNKQHVSMPLIWQERCQHMASRSAVHIMVRVQAAVVAALPAMSPVLGGRAEQRGQPACSRGTVWL